MKQREITIRRVDETLTSEVEAILQDAVLRLKEEKGIDQWGLENVAWKALSCHYRPEDFYLALVDGEPAGTLALVDYDPAYWPQADKGEACFIHKLAVRRAYAGQGVADALLRFAVKEARKAGAATLRLDCRATRPELRRFYEARGFRFVGERRVFADYVGAFYVYPIEGF